MKKLIVVGLVAASLIGGAVAASATPLRGSLGLSGRSNAGCSYTNTGEAYSNTGASSSQGGYCP